jgi:hypothetical protein
MLIRLIWLVQIVLGLAFWTGRGVRFVSVHMLLGVVFVLLLWALVAVAAGARAKSRTIPLLVLWAALVLVLGLTQTRLMVGGAHWVIQVLHLLVGVGALFIAERLAAKVKRARA